MVKTYTNLYISLSREDDEYIDNLRLTKVKEDKRHYTKTEIAKHLINLGIDVEKGCYLKLDASIDEFVSKLQNMVIELNGEKIVVKKNKQQVYQLIIEKGLKHLSD